MSIKVRNAFIGTFVVAALGLGAPAAALAVETAAPLSDGRESAEAVDGGEVLDEGVASDGSPTDGVGAEDKADTQGSEFASDTDGAADDDSAKDAVTPEGGSTDAGASTGSTSGSESSTGGDASEGTGSDQDGASTDGSQGEDAGKDGSGSSDATGTKSDEGSSDTQPSDGSGQKTDSDGEADSDPKTDTDGKGTEGGDSSSGDDSGDDSGDAYVSDKKGWNKDGTGYCKDPGVVYTGYVVDNHVDKKTTERYWIENGWLFKNGMFDSRDGYYGYSLSDGTVLRGVYRNVSEGTVYIANNDGRLITGTKDDKTGWTVTSAYGQGLQRYYIESDHKIHTGYSDSGYAHFTTDEGYVLRGGIEAPDGSIYYADCDGRLQKSGWVVTPDVTGENERYWLEDHKAVKDTLVNTGKSYAYAKSDGVIVRGVYSNGELVYLADNDGNLECGDKGKGGWVVTEKYGQGQQRYWIEPEKHAAVIGYDDGSANKDLGNYAHFTTKKGYVLRGGMRAFDDNVYYADNNGKLQKSGWLVTADVTGENERYWLEDHKAVKDTLIDTGSSYAYAKSDGRILRGTYKADGLVYLADNDGTLECGKNGKGGWVVTEAYAPGQGLQRYWIDPEKHAAVIGYDDGSANKGLGNYAHCTSTKGYVVRGAGRVDDKVYLADNDGRLTSLTGWQVTSDFGQGQQRYWIEKGGWTQIGYSSDGYDHCTTKDGYVVRGKYRAENGYIYLADNDGRLYTGDTYGWMITAEFDGTMQRYRIDPEAHACVPGTFTLGDYDYYTTAKNGWVLRGSTTVNGKTINADNDGRIITSVVVSASVKKSGDATNIESTYVGDTMYLFLPSYASLTKVPIAALRLSGATDIYLSSTSGGTYTLYTAFADADLKSISQNKLSNGALMLFYKTSTGSGSVARKLAVMLSSDVTSVFVLSVDSENQGRAYVEASSDHSAKADVAVVVVASDGTVLYNKDDISEEKTSTIKGRGNTSWGASDKKPYQISFNKKADLLNTGNSDNAKKKWVLLANSNDVTLLHNTVAFNLAQELGLGAMDCTAVDLWYDGEYRGSYLLCEKVEINSGRVDIHDLESDVEDANDGTDLESQPTAKGTNKYGYTYQYVVGVKDPENITGGYLLEFDSAYYKKETCYFQTSRGYVVVKSPEFCSKSSMRYISEAFQAALDNLENNTASSYTFDLDSFAKAYLVNEFFKNTDYAYSSTYFYIDRDEQTFVASPVWDFDSAMTRKGYGRWNSYNGFMNTVGIWMLMSTKVQDTIKSVYSDFSGMVHDVLLGDTDAVGSEGYLHSLKYYRSNIDKSQKMDEVIWGLTSFGNQLQPYSTYQRNYEYLAEWIENRVNWLDEAVYTLNGPVIDTWEAKYNGVDYTLVFDAQYYKEMNPDVAAVYGTSNEALFEHFVIYGMSEGRVASRNFDVHKYAELNSDVRAAYGTNWAGYYLHYLQYGFSEGRYSK